jgi:hypothetical protein
MILIHVLILIGAEEIADHGCHRKGLKKTTRKPEYDLDKNEDGVPLLLDTTGLKLALKKDIIRAFLTKHYSKSLMQLNIDKILRH